MRKQITLKKAIKIFPDKWTRVRPHDLISQSIKSKKHLTPKESEKLQNIADEFRNYRKSDLLIERKGRLLKIKEF